MLPITPIKHKQGFTLIEILIALFIFAIISMILVAALRSVIEAEAGTERNAERLRTVQMALLLISRDMEQSVARPVLNASGGEEVAFIGTPHDVTFTHIGFVTVPGTVAKSSLERTRYTWHDNALWRVSWQAVDSAPRTATHERLLLSNVEAVDFQYMDNQQHFYRSWPGSAQNKQPLPKAVRMVLILSNWGRLSQLYVIPVTASAN
jgi:general secretion pathway protein J